MSIADKLTTIAENVSKVYQAGYDKGFSDGWSAAGGELPKLAAGLYQTGAIALYEEQGASAVEGMMTKSWDDLFAEGVVHVNNGNVYTNLDTNTW